MRAEFMKQEGFDVQVLILDNRPLIYEVDAELGRQLLRAYNDTARRAPWGCAVSAVLSSPSLSQIDKAGSFG